MASSSSSPPSSGNLRDVSTVVILFNVSTNVKPTSSDFPSFISKTIAELVENIEEKPKLGMGLVINFTTKVDDAEPDRTCCVITHFKEELSDDAHKNLHQTATLFESLLNKWLDVKKHEFVITISNYKDKILVSWTDNNLIGTMPIRNQRKTLTCWAFSVANVITCNYIIEHPLVKTRKECTCSAEELIEWVYSVEGSKKKKPFRLDRNGSYSTHPRYPLSYVREQGVSLLENYAIHTGKRKLRSDYEEMEFNQMRISKGPRIFIKDYSNIKPEDGTFFSRELVTKILSQGVVYGRIEYCIGNCSVPGCKGFQNFDGNSVYEELPHPPNFVYSRHGITVLRVGNSQGRDYVHVQNSFGTGWGRRGRGDIHFKCLKEIYQVVGTEKKELKGEEWV